MIDILGYLAMIIVLVGFYMNSTNSRLFAFISWIIGDVMWICYDVIRGIYPHLVLSSVIILLNLIGIYKYYNKK